MFARRREVKLVVDKAPGDHAMLCMMNGSTVESQSILRYRANR